MMDMGLEEGRHFTVKMPEAGMRVTCISVGRVLSVPLGSPYTAPKNSRGGRR